MDLKKRNVERMWYGLLADYLEYEHDPQDAVIRFDELYGVAFDSTEARVNRLIAAKDGLIKKFRREAEKLESVE